MRAFVCVFYVRECLHFSLIGHTFGLLFVVVLSPFRFILVVPSLPTHAQPHRGGRFINVVDVFGGQVQTLGCERV